jgi:CxxC motif-containing protein (DUF1111 family)
VIRTIVAMTVAAALASLPASAIPVDTALGGPATVVDSGRNAFGFPAPVLDRLQRRAFAVGNAFFKENWVAAPSSTEGRDGLGPLFNARSCSACHLNDGRGRPPPEAAEELEGFLLRIGVADGAGGAGPHPVYGTQLQDLALPGVAAEGRVAIRRTLVDGRYPDGAQYQLERPDYGIDGQAWGAPGEGVVLSPRVAQQLSGVGLLEAIPAEAILARADPDDRDGDGISGRANVVRDERSGRTALGRFGWKAGQPTIEQQVATAFLHDIGITSSLFPQEPLTPAQRSAIERPSGGAPELDDHKLARVTFYCQALAVPAQRDADAEPVRRGERFFEQAGCARCHVPSQMTGDYPPIPAFGGASIRPFTDLLLHDMGPGLADGAAEGLATGSEWRTPPLWGIGLFETVSGHTRYLHDGRARNLEEAILWHGGEAEAARAAFMDLSAADRADLVAYLQSL